MKEIQRISKSRNAKVCKRCVVKREIRHKQFRQCLFGNTIEEKLQKKTVRNIHSDHHHVYTAENSKIALCNYNNKRFAVDNLTSLPYGHYKITLRSSLSSGQ